MGHRLSAELEREVRRLVGGGLGHREIGRLVGIGHQTVPKVLRRVSSPVSWDPSPARLSLAEREEIRVGLERGEAFSVIARRLGRAVSSVSRDVAANGGRSGYQAWRAHRRAGERARRPKPSKLALCPRLRERVIADLEAWWSPEQIARRLRDEFGNDASMRISHETIYQSLYVQGRGELRRELARCLRSGRARRRSRGQLERRGKIADMVMISERPAEVEDRAVPGHWEGDLIMGKNGKSAIGTLVERSTRFVMLLHLPNGRGAEQVRDAMTVAIQTLPASLRRSVTWDQGKEMAQHREFSVDTGVAVYFCDPHSPWQRGTNENTNGLLRQYFPKGTDLSVHDATILQAAADSLNGRPRETLNWKKPHEKLTELIATTA
jgi:transposase, IS30 family